MKKTILVISVLLALGVVQEAVYADLTIGEPVNLGPSINSAGFEESPSLSSDGLSLYFASTRNGGFDIYVTTRPSPADDWGEPVKLGPQLNRGGREQAPSISPNGLELYHTRVWNGNYDIWVSTRETTEDSWGDPARLGTTINKSSSIEFQSNFSPDGLSLYFGSTRSGGSGNADLWLTTRETINSAWSTAVNLGPTVNSSAHDGFPSISADESMLFFSSWGISPYRPEGFGASDLWMTRRTSAGDDSSTPVNLGSAVNTADHELGPAISPDGSTLYFMSDRPGGYGEWDLWQASIQPVVDFTGDYRVDIKDLALLIEHWGQNETAYDMGPMPWGDGVVDINDLEVLMSYWGKELDPNFIAHWKLDEAGGDVAYDSVADNEAVVMGDALWQREGGQVDGALQFDGVTSYLSAPFIIDPSTRQPFSAYVWVKGGQGGQTIMSQQGASSEWLSLDAQGALTCTLTFPLPPVTSDAVITDDLWHHIGLVSDGSGISLHVDDIEVARSDAPPLMPSTGDLQIGTGKNQESGTFWSGLIDDVRIYDRVVKP
ncbi:MAG: hypothetical protein GY809_02035 [Planctomycetes bacterium]|nr:hypothetical protein [Planctomycetota bacterium]